MPRHRYKQASSEGSLPEHTDHGFLTLLLQVSNPHLSLTYSSPDLVTLLLQDGGGGLQARNVAGTWVDVPPQPHSLVINTGRLLSRWTNNVFPATFHRVQNNPGSDRYSIPLFFGTNFDTVIKPLDCCLSSESGSGSSAGGSAGGGLEPVVCGEYITEGYAWQVRNPHLEPSPDPHLILT